MVFAHFEEKNSGLQFCIVEVHTNGPSGTADKTSRHKYFESVTNYFINDQYANIPIIFCGDFDDLSLDFPLKTLDKDSISFYQIQELNSN